MFGSAMAELGTRTFFVLAFLITWGLQLPAVILGERWLPLVGLGALGPTVAALIVARRDRTPIFRPVRAHRVSPLWYAIALFMPGALLAIGMAVYGGKLFYPPNSPERMVAFFVMPIAEEIGWRGLALPRLQQRHGAVRASLILGVLWALWHIPMFMLAKVPLTLLPQMIVFMCAGSLVFTWLYNRSGGSLMIAVVAHAGAHLNNSHIPLPADGRPFAVHTVAYVIAAIAVVALDRRAFSLPSARAGASSGSGAGASPAPLPRSVESARE